MIDELVVAFKRAGQQPEDVQRSLAHRLAEWIEEQEDEREWDALVGSQEGQAVLADLAAEARRDIIAGKTRDLDELL